MVVLYWNNEHGKGDKYCKFSVLQWNGHDNVVHLWTCNLGMVFLSICLEVFTNYISTCFALQDARTGYYMAGLFFVAVGTGGIKANVGPYGALQAEQIGPQAVQTFFQW